MYLAEGVETHRVEVLLASYLGILDDGSGRVVDYHHCMVTLYEEKVKWHEILRPRRFKCQCKEHNSSKEFSHLLVPLGGTETYIYMYEGVPL